MAAAVTEIRSALPRRSAEPSQRVEDLKERIHGLAERCAAMIAEVARVICDQNLGIHLRDELICLRDQILQVAA